jgi:hypothetical protein
MARNAFAIAFCPLWGWIAIMVSTKLPLSKLFDGRLFQIPDYQRAYSWTRHQRRDLFGDLQKTHAKGRMRAISWQRWFVCDVASRILAQMNFM